MSFPNNPCMVTAFTLNESRTITAYTLLHCYLEFSNLVPNKQKWSEEELSKDSLRLFRCLPRRVKKIIKHFIIIPDNRREKYQKLYRFLQLNAMLHAFEFEDLASFHSGMFIERNGINQYAKAFAMTSEGKLLTDSHFPHYYFQTLLSYREKVEQLLHFGSDDYWICQGFPSVSEACQKIWQFNAIIKENITAIDKILVAFISPEAKSFPVENLIRDYGYPDVNISELDLDCLHGVPHSKCYYKNLLQSST